MSTVTLYIVTQLVFSVLLVASLLLRKPGETPKPIGERGERIRLVVCVCFLLWEVALVSACGGGGNAEPAQPDRTINPPDCKTHPERCT